jgi:hypothetical protein
MSHFNKLSERVQANWKVYHVECDRCFAKDIQRLMHYAKEMGQVAKFWGRHAHVSEVVDKSSSPRKIRCLVQIAQPHMSYQCSMILEDISGMVDLDGSAAVKDEETGWEIGTYSLCTILLKYLRLSDGHQLIVEIHQAKESMAPVQAVIPNTPKAERMIAMMNKNFPSYVGNVLKDQGLLEEFLMELFHQTCCQIMLADFSQTSWYPETGTLTTAKDLAQERTTADLMNASWFKNAFSELDLDKSKGKKQQAPPPEALFDLDGEWLVTTIHKHHVQQTTTTGPPCPAKDSNKFVDLADTDGDDSAFSPDDNGPHVHISQGVDGASPSSSDEKGENEHAAGGG